MRLGLRDPISETRVDTPGTLLHVLMLAPSRQVSIGVDLASRSFVRLFHPHPTDVRTAPRFGDVAVGRVGLAAEDAHMDSPEVVQMSTPLQAVGKMKPRQIERLLEPLQQQPGTPLFGCEGPAIPMWALPTTSSITLIEPQHDISLQTGSSGVTASFRWRGYTYRLPVEDRRVLARLDWLPPQPVQGRPLAELIGFFPSRLLIGLTAPQHGYCYKAVSALMR
jgi:hypothetical protein